MPHHERPSQATNAQVLLDLAALGSWGRVRYAQESYAEADRLERLASEARAGLLDGREATAQSLSAQARHLKRTSALVCLAVALAPSSSGWLPVALAGLLGGLVGGLVAGVAVF